MYLCDPSHILKPLIVEFQEDMSYNVQLERIMNKLS
jgi:hypothetical protein